MRKDIPTDSAPVEMELRAALEKFGCTDVKFVRFVEQHDIETDETTVRVEMTCTLPRKAQVTG